MGVTVSRVRWRPPVWLAALWGYMLVAVGLTWPLVLHLDDRFPGDHQVDAWIHVWNIWWLKVALTNLKNPYYTTFWFAPEGTPLTLHTLAPFNSALGVLPLLVAGPLVAYNLVALATLTFNGQAAFLLVRHLIGRADAAWVAGLTFAGAPYVLGHLNVGHLNIAALAWLPLFALTLLLTAERGWRWAPAAAVCLAMTALCDWHATLFAIILGSVLIATRLAIALWRRGDQGAPLRMVVASLLGGLLLLPLVLLTLQTLRAVGERAELGERWAERHSANLLALVLPQDLHPLWGEAVQRWRAENLIEVMTEGRVSLGLSVLVLAAIGVLVARWRAVPWMVVAAIGVALAIGPTLYVGRWSRPLLTPWDLLVEMPLIDVSRTPARLVALTVLALTVLAGYGLRWLAERAGGHRAASARLAVVGVLVVGELLSAPYPLSTPPDRHVAEVIGQEIAAIDPAGTVLTLPYRLSEEQRLYHQVFHQRPLFGGFIARDIERPFRANTPGFADLTGGEAPADIFMPEPDPLEALSYYRVRYVLFYRDEVPEDRERPIRRALQRVLNQERPVLVSADGDIEAWRVPAVPVDDSFARAGEGWYPAEIVPALGLARWMAPQGYLYLERPEVVGLEISFEAVSLERARRVEVLLGERSLGVFSIGTTPTPVRVRVPPDDGTDRLILRSLDGARIPPGRNPSGKGPISIAIAHVLVQEV